MRVAVLGATGAVGGMILRLLEDRLPEVEEIVPLASARSSGREIEWRGRNWRIEEPGPDTLSGCELAFFSAGATRSREWAPVAVDGGAVVIDNSSAWRLDPEVPLIVPEVNGDRTKDLPRGIIANPNCVVIQVALVLEALRRRAGLRRAVVSSYQAVSGAGRAGAEALSVELDGGTPEASPFPARIMGNVIPLIGELDSDGWTDEEEKLRAESRKILGLPDLAVAATCVRVPVEVGHAVSLTIECAEPIDLPTAEEALEEMPGVTLHRGDELPPLPSAVAGTDLVRVGRLRLDRDLPGVVHLWVVADNLRRGAATNAVEIAAALGRA